MILSVKMNESLKTLYEKLQIEVIYEWAWKKLKLFFDSQNTRKMVP
jgi:hypothetical protein